MKFAFMNDDPRGILGSIYDNDLPHPYFDPEKIAFAHLRTYDHYNWIPREQSNRTIVFQDLEHLLPYEDEHFNTDDNIPCKEGDYLIKSCITRNDHMWPCEHTFSSWHLINTSMANSKIVVKQDEQRPYFANMLFGNTKHMRAQFFHYVKENNLLDKNLINLFHVYKSPYIDEGKDDIDKFFTNIEQKEYINTAINEFQGKPTFTSHLISKHIEEATWISVVAETLDSEDIFFPTEKTGKPMLCGKPFIVLSGKNYLKNLREIGFKTFDPIIDESYDLIDDRRERVKSAFRSFVDLSKQDPLLVKHKLQNILDHNQKCMQDKLWLSRNARAMLDPLTTDV